MMLKRTMHHKLFAAALFSFAALASMSSDIAAAGELDELVVATYHPSPRMWQRLTFTAAVNGPHPYAHVTLHTTSQPTEPANDARAYAWRQGTPQYLKAVELLVSALEMPQPDEQSIIVKIPAQMDISYPLLNFTTLNAHSRHQTYIPASGGILLEVPFGDPAHLEQCFQHLDKSHPNWRDTELPLAERDTLVISFNQDMSYDIEIEPGLCHDFLTND